MSEDIPEKLYSHKDFDNLLIKEFIKDLEEYQFSIGCTYCDCEKKMWKLQEKWEKRSEKE